ncbi:hypothetical protein Tsubulata_036814 [Turnera subulata]|uniref:RING-type E3 ubiquitin transferase n=1 Tax=Turnera subulata TaxID=218843 RepID=A0A9Q0FCC6_9ROSI|nr:hypothetical protein Tsubulata_036814 [Turnera subulata]
MSTYSDTCDVTPWPIPPPASCVCYRCCRPIGYLASQITCTITYTVNRRIHQHSPSGGCFVLEPSSSHSVQFQTGPATFLKHEDLITALRHLGVPWAFGPQLCQQIFGAATDIILTDTRWSVSLGFDIVRTVKQVQAVEEDYLTTIIMARELEIALRESRLDFERNNCGMVPTAQKALMRLKPVRLALKDGGNNDCAICLEGMVDTALAMPCNHTFHRACITKWLKTSHYCPICRFQMPTE